VRSITELCGLRISMQTYVAPNAHCNASAASASATRSNTAMGATTSMVGALHRGSSLNAAAGRGIHTANYRGCIK
jgi:hypothetical protein